MVKKSSMRKLLVSFFYILLFSVFVNSSTLVSSQMNHNSIQGWSEDIRVTFGGESGGSGRFIHMFHIDQIGNYYFIGYNRGNEFTFLTKIDEMGTLLIDEKNLLSEQPLYVLFDESQNDIYIFHKFESRDEIGYSKYDENGEKVIDSNIISDIDLWKSYNPIATIDKENNIVIFWLDQNSTSSEGSRQIELMYKKMDNNGLIIENKSVFTFFADPWGSSVLTSLSHEGNYYFFWKEETQNNVYDLFYGAMNLNGIIIQNKTLLISRQALYGQIWNRDKFLCSSKRIHLLTAHTEIKSTAKGQFISLLSYINYNQFSNDGIILSKHTLFSPTNGSIFDISASFDENQRIHLAWADDKDYNPSPEGAGYGEDYPREIYYFILDANGPQSISPTRLTEIDHKSSRDPYLYTKENNVYVIWSDNRHYQGSDVLNGFDLFLKSTASLGFSTVKIQQPTDNNQCLIATATYGSELSPQVQFLRGFRDNTVYSTFAGSSFMTVFNGFYYSFSPSVASVIADHSVLRDIMKVVLYPLIGILQVSSAAFSVFSFLPEFGVVVAGLIASVLIGIIYFLPIALIFSLKKRFQVSEKIVRFMGIFWIGSVLTLVVAEVFKIPSIMMMSTGTFVLLTIVTATLTSLRIVSKRLIH